MNLTNFRALLWNTLTSKEEVNSINPTQLANLIEIIPSVRSYKVLSGVVTNSLNGGGPVINYFDNDFGYYPIVHDYVTGDGYFDLTFEEPISNSCLLVTYGQAHCTEERQSNFLEVEITPKVRKLGANRKIGFLFPTKVIQYGQTNQEHVAWQGVEDFTFEIRLYEGSVDYVEPPQSI